MPARPGKTRELATVLFTDVVDSTTQLARTGDRAWASTLDALDTVTTTESRRRGGEVVKTTGDGALLLLPGPSAAVECALALHQAAADLGIVLRIGAHTGEIERRGTDLAGMAVHTAARLMSSAAPGETLVSATLRSLVTDSAHGFEDRGALDLKGIDQPTKAFAVTAAPLSRPVPEQPPATELDAVRRLLQSGRYEEAADLALSVTDVSGLAETLLLAESRTEFLDVDLALTRILQDALDRLSDESAGLRSRIAAKLAFELRGDASLTDERRDLLEVAASAARLAADEVAETEAQLATIHALWEPAGVAARLEAAERVIALARNTRRVEHELEGRLARFQALVETGRVQDAEFEITAYGRLAAPLDRADTRVYVASRRALLATMTGRYDEAIEQADVAYGHARAAGMQDADRLLLAHRIPVQRDRGFDEVTLVRGVGTLREQVRTMPGHYLECTLAEVLLHLGRPEEARLELVRVLPSLLTTSGYRWLFAACQAADVAAAVDSGQLCSRLYDVLLPHEGRFVVMGPTFFGSVSDRLGVLALHGGRAEDAVAHGRRAVAELDAITALPLAAWARLHLARALRAAGESPASTTELAAAAESARALGMTRLLAEIEQEAPDDPADPVEPAVGAAWRLTRDGEDWVLEAGAEQGRFRSSLGFDYLHTLLANPHQDIAAHRLEAGDAPVQPGVEVLDHQALAAYRRRLEQLEEEVEAADRAGDQQRGADLEEERERLLAELRSATGLGGRIRRSNDAGERARVNVTRNIKRALDQIQRRAPIAGAHLAACIRTGTHCRYDPVPGGPETWTLTG